MSSSFTPAILNLPHLGVVAGIFQHQGVLLILKLVRQGSTVLAVGAGRVVWTVFLSSVIIPHFLSLPWHDID